MQVCKGPGDRFEPSSLMSGKLEHVLLKGMVLVALLAALATGCSSSTAPSPTPTPTPTLSATLAATPAVTATPSPTSTPLSLEEAVGQMLLIGFPGTELENDTAALLQEISPGGVILFDYDGPTQGALPRNIESRGQLRSLIDSLQGQADIPLLVAIDAEGGKVNRLKSEYGFEVTVPSHQELGAMLPSETKEIVLPLAEELKWLGINWNLAPVVDVNVNTESPAIGALGRSFDVDPNVVAAHAVAFVEAHSEVGIISTLKHFPGHGSATGDTRLGVTDVTDTFDQSVELAPYQWLIDGGYPGTIMTAHIVNRKLDSTETPATLSHRIITGLLRDDLGFDGVVVSDDIQMGAIVEAYELEPAAVQAVQAGVDVILVAGQANGDINQVRRIKQAILQAVQDGEISEDRIYESADRILALKRAYRIAN